ncbi:MAG: hypothetical protein AAF487_04665 [Bacteroidota bacterium]
MNKKVLTYVLLVVVIGIWGRVIYTFFFAEKGGEPILFESKKDPLPELTEDVQDSIVLIADYRDPFLGKVQRAPSQTTVNTVQHNVPRSIEKKGEEEPPIVWPEVAYFGMQKNLNSQARLGIVKIGKKQVLLKEGEEVDELKALRIFPDSIELGYLDESRTFKSN